MRETPLAQPKVLLNTTHIDVASLLALNTSHAHFFLLGYHHLLISENMGGSSDDGREFALKSLIGTSQARFLNQYNPQFDKPIEHKSLDSGAYIDPELAKLLEEERRSAAMQQHHKKKDFMKSYHDECVKFAAITKGGKK